MSRFPLKLPDATIPNGQTLSGIYQAADFRDADSILIEGPATLPETIHVMVSSVPNAQASDLQPLLNPQTGLLYVIAAGQALLIPQGWQAFAIGSTGAVAADRVFKINKTFTV